MLTINGVLPDSTGNTGPNDLGKVREGWPRAFGHPSLPMALQAIKGSWQRQPQFLAAAAGLSDVDLATGDRLVTENVDVSNVVEVTRVDGNAAVAAVVTAVVT